MKLAKYLANLGYGTRSEVERMLRSGRVTRRDGSALSDGDHGYDVTHDDILVDGTPLDPPPGVVFMLHKPDGYVSSTTDDTNPTVYDLLPQRLRLRSPIVAPAGRLDVDTSGLLLLTDDGELNHRITSPRRHLPRTYEAVVHSDLRGDEPALFASGTMMLKGDSSVLAPVVLEIIEARKARVTLTEGRYHQVRRMFALAGNHVETLHRIAIGNLTLGHLPSGGWRILSAEETDQLCNWRRDGTSQEI
jgi:16S rRNA pseudouridine516 synthase